ncbi:MAG: hypothetical protein HKN04_06300 [Rhodothermaceae bacterium]|nr:hypothetical protein [Rhodothermaceae bacterium]
MNCRDAEPYLLDPPAHLDAAVRAHLTTCAACRTAQATLIESQVLLRTHLPVPPPSVMRTAFYTTLVELQRTRKAVVGPGRWIVLWRSHSLRLAFAFLVVFALGAVSMQILQADQASGSEVQAVLSQLGAPSPATRLTGVYTVSEGEMTEAQVHEALLTVIRTDPSVNVRVAALEVLTAHAQDAAVRAAVVHVLGSDPAPLVQLAALRFIEAHPSAEVHRALDTLLQQPDLEPFVRAQVRTFLTTPI